MALKDFTKNFLKKNPATGGEKKNFFSQKSEKKPVLLK